MEFLTGDAIEVSSKQEGFNGSYYEATAVAKVPSCNAYVVEYKTLVEDDMSTPLRELVVKDELRPTPRSLGNIGGSFRFGDIVDAFDNDGWWVGTICGINEEEDSYYVYFDYFRVGIFYKASRLRMHQDWKKGKWSLPRPMLFPKLS